MLADFKMQNTLEGKVVAVIGASSGIGEGIVRAFADYSPKGIVVAARRVDKLKSIAEEMAGRGQSVLVIPTDVTKKAAFQNLIDKTVERYGHLDVVVNSAGVIQGDKHHRELSEEEVRTIIATNFEQVLNSAPVIQSYFERQKSGVYIVLSSHAATKHFPGQAPYNATKAAASSVAITMDNEFKELRDTHNYKLWAFALEPGFVDTEDARKKFDNGEFQEMLDKAPKPYEFGKIVAEYALLPKEKHAQSGARHIIETV